MVEYEHILVFSHELDDFIPYDEIELFFKLDGSF